MRASVSKTRSIHIDDDIDFLVITGDLHSMAAPLAEVDRLVRDLPGSSRIFVNGDIFPMGTEPLLTLEWVMERAGDGVVMGNHDEAVVGSRASGQAFYTEAGIHEALGSTELSYLKKLPYRLDLEWRGHSLRLRHSHRFPDGAIRPKTSFATKPGEQCDIYGDDDVDLAVQSHTHFPFLRRHQGEWVANTGTTSLPILSVKRGDDPPISQDDDGAAELTREPLCSFLLVREGGAEGTGTGRPELQPEIVHFDYDREATIASLESAGHPDLERWRTLLTSGVLAV